jgi:histidinol-phosphate aminotransferase
MNPYTFAELIAPAIHQMNAYHVPPAQNMIKLDAMENPYLLPEVVAHALQSQLNNINIARYPAADAAVLVEKISRVFNVSESSRVILGNGSDEIIQMLMLLLNKAVDGGGVLAVEPSFVMYRLLSMMVGVPYHGVSLNADFSLNVADVLQKMAETRPQLVFLAVPNNPTGNVFSQQDVLHIIEAAPGLVVVDEAYSAFTESNYLPLLPRYPNLLVMRTLSKIGLAGLRLGWLAGADAIVHELHKVRLPYNINAYTQTAVSIALDHFDAFITQTQQICASRKALFDELSTFSQLKVYESEANFLLVKVKELPASVIFQLLKDCGILVKCLHLVHPLLENTLRITVGTPKENNALLAALQNIFTLREKA